MENTSTLTNPTTGREIEVRGLDRLTAEQRSRVLDIDAVAADGVDEVYVMQDGIGDAAIYLGGRYSREAQFVILVNRLGGVINAEDELVREYVAGEWH